VDQRADKKSPSGVGGKKFGILYLLQVSDLNIHMEQQSIYIGVVGIVIGIFAGYIFGQASHSGHREERGDQHGMMNAMHDMNAHLEGKTGDDFDKAFLADMIVHHEGAVEMAKSALVNAKHQEIKDLSQAIIDAQNSEIQMMKEWQSAWYKD